MHERELTMCICMHMHTVHSESIQTPSTFVNLVDKILNFCLTFVIVIFQKFNNIKGFVECLQLD